jgi:hypothetical protein
MVTCFGTDSCKLEVRQKEQNITFSEIPNDKLQPKKKKIMWRVYTAITSTVSTNLFL